jgi:hypothetical protein
MRPALIILSLAPAWKINVQSGPRKESGVSCFPDMRFDSINASYPFYLTQKPIVPWFVFKYLLTHHTVFSSPLPGERGILLKICLQTGPLPGIDLY